MNNIFKIFAGLIITVSIVGCSDILETNPNDILDTEDYINKEDEMYKGFLGILNRMQEAGDHSIFLTDTRCNYLEVTDNAPDALQDIYNYQPTDGNEYANPTCYYAIVIACNDYFYKMGEYHKTVGGMSESAETHFKALISSAVRIKAWAYYMLGRIYGQAYWTDDPLTEMKDLGDASVFTHCDMKVLMDKCIALLDNGVTVDGVAIDAKQEMNWYEWLDEENQNASNYYKWQYLTPPWLLLRAELLSWRCNYLPADAARADWQWIHDNILQYLYDLHNGNITVPAVSNEKDNNGNFIETLGYIFQLNIPLQSDAANAYFKIFCSEEIGSKMQIASAIMYDYDNHQRNRLVQYFCPTWPGTDGFFLKPSAYGVNLYNEQDLRSPVQKMVVNSDLNGEPAVTKFYYCYDFFTRSYQYLRERINEIQPTILTFRGHDFHFLLAEAENHLGHEWSSAALLGNGLTNEFADKTIPVNEQWGTVTTVTGSQGQDSLVMTTLYDGSWFGGNGGYGNSGIAGTMLDQTYYVSTSGDRVRVDSLRAYCKQQMSAGQMTEEQRIRLYDEVLAYEYSKEYIAEGKAYSYLCKMAERYNDKNIVVHIVEPKYAASGKPGKCANYIASNGYWVQWNLLNESNTKK